MAEIIKSAPAANDRSESWCAMKLPHYGFRFVAIGFASSLSLLASLSFGAFSNKCFYLLGGVRVASVNVGWLFLHRLFLHVDNLSSEVSRHTRDGGFVVAVDNQMTKVGHNESDFRCERVIGLSPSHRERRYFFDLFLIMSRRRHNAAFYIQHDGNFQYG